MLEGKQPPTLNAHDTQEREPMDNHARDYNISFGVNAQGWKPTTKTECDIWAVARIGASFVVSQETLAADAVTPDLTLFSLGKRVWDRTDKGQFIAESDFIRVSTESPRYRLVYYTDRKGRNSMLLVPEPLDIRKTKPNHDVVGNWRRQRIIGACARQFAEAACVKAQVELPFALTRESLLLRSCLQEAEILLDNYEQPTVDWLYTKFPWNCAPVMIYGWPIVTALLRAKKHNPMGFYRRLILCALTGGKPKGSNSWHLPLNLAVPNWPVLGRLTKLVQEHGCLGGAGPCFVG